MSKKRPLRPPSRFHWLSELALRSLAVFAVVAGAVFVYAATLDWPDEPYTPTGLEATFAGVTNAPFSTPLTYATANDLCEDAIADSHLCTTDEILHSYNTDSPTVIAQTGAAWFNNGPPADLDRAVNDCGGWSSTDSVDYGSVWSFTEDKALVMSCNVSSLKFACCR